MSVVKTTLILVVTSVVLLLNSGCSLVRDLTGEKEPLGLSPAGLGAATGAVVGSGVGAIIGSQSGNAGVGLAIGAASGAVLGGALGQQEERENHSREERSLRAERQDELLKANRNRIDEYKRGEDLARERRGALAIPRTSQRSPYVNMPSGYRGNPRAVSYTRLALGEEFSTTDSSVSSKPTVARIVPPVTTKVRTTSHNTSLQVAVNDVVQPKVVSKSAQVDLISPQVRTVKVDTRESALVPVVAEPTLPKAVTPESRLKEADDSMKSEISMATVTNGIVGVPVQVGKEPIRNDEEGIKTTIITGSKISKVASDDDCSRADLEYQRATNSISDADKLFYLRRALRLCSSKPNLHLAAGRVYTKLGRIEDAEYEFRQALDLEPNNVEATKELNIIKQKTR